jgi:hypothetical protein
MEFGSRSTGWNESDAPKEALPFLHARLKPVPVVSADALRKLVADLDDNLFGRRETAAKQLKNLGRQAELTLRMALKAKPSLEQKRRLEGLLAALPETPPLSAEELRQRCIAEMPRIDRVQFAPAAV